MLFAWVAFFIASFIAIKRKIGKCFKLAYAVFSLTVLTESLARFLNKLHRMDLIDFFNNLILFNIYEIIVFPILFLLYYKLIKTEKRRVVPYFFLAFILICLIDGIWFSDYTQEYETYPFIVGSIGLSVSVVFYLAQILEDGSFDAIKNNFFFWFSCGVLIYYLGNTPFYSVTNFFAFSPGPEKLFYIISKILAIIMYILICLGLFKYKLADE